MSEFNFADAVTQPTQQTLQAMIAVLDKAKHYCEARRIDPAALIQSRLYPDMLPFAMQVRQTAAHSAGACARLTGKPAPEIGAMATFDDLQKILADALAYVRGLSAADFEGAASKIVAFKAGPNEMTFTGANYWLSFAQPNFYFHATTAYDLLRHNGLEVGKMDFMGPLRLAA